MKSYGNILINIICLNNTKYKIYSLHLMIRSNRGTEKYEYDGYLYVFDKYVSMKMLKSWRCDVEFEKNKKCKGRIYTIAKTGAFLR